MRPLSQKQKLFVEAYLVNPNATEAARKAGYKGNDVTLASVGAENLRKPQIAERLQERVEAEIMSANEVLTELAEIAKADWQDFLEIRRDKHGDIIDASLKLSDKIKALELVGKYHKLFTEKVEHGGEVNQKVIVEFEQPK
jgi:phage terminase small subunit